MRFLVVFVDFMKLTRNFCFLLVFLLVILKSAYGQSCTSTVSVGSITLTGSNSICNGGLIDARYLEYEAGDTAFWYKNNQFIIYSRSNYISIPIDIIGTVEFKIILHKQNRNLPCSTASAYLTVNSYPITPQITVTGNNNCANSPVSFSIANPEVGVNYTWDFGVSGAASAYGSSVSYTFPQVFGAGTNSYNVQVAAIRNNCSTLGFTTAIVKQLPDPLLIDDSDLDQEFRNCDNASRTNQNFSISISQSSTTATSNIRYSINWGDNSPVYTNSTLSNVSHTYSRLGIFPLTFTVTGNNSCINTRIYQVINISNPSNGLTNQGSTTGCLPQTFTFLVDTARTNANHESTVYDINFGDGSPMITVPHPINRLLTHRFDTSSCGFNTGSGRNSFIVSVTARNLCLETPATVGGIKIYKAPKARFNTSSKITCINRPITFTNTTTLGFNSSCLKNTRFLWTFSDGSAPISVNYSGTSGTLADIQTKSFSVPGTYIITLSANNTICDSTLYRDTVCVAVLPRPRFLYNYVGAPSIPCTGTQVNITNRTNLITQTCSQATYQWSIATTNAYASCDYPRVVSPFTFVNGTNPTSVNPSLYFNKPGTYRITLQVNNVCSPSGVTWDTLITIKGRPLISSIGGLSPICAGQTASLTANVQACNATTPLQYLWSFYGTGVSPSTSNVANPSIIRYSTSGIFQVRLIVSNECGSDTMNNSIVVRPFPAITRNINDVTICEGQSSSLIVNGTISSGTVNYAWQSSINNGNTWQNIANNANYNGSNNDTLLLNNIPFSLNATRFRVLVSNQGICSDTSNVALLTVNPNVVFTTQPANKNVCIGDTTSFRISLSGSIPGLNYQWQESTDGASWSNLSSSSNYFGVNTNALIITNTPSNLDGKYYRVKVTSSGTCVIYSNSARLRVNQLPIVVSPPANAITCINANVSFNVTTDNAPSNFQWQESSNTGTTWINVNSTAQRVINSTGASSALNIIAPTSSDNTHLFRCIVRNVSNCLATSSSASLTVNQLPSAQITASDTVICEGDTIQLSVNDGIAGETYSWSPNATLNSSIGNLVRAFPTRTTSYTLQTNNSSGCNNLARKTIVVNPLPLSPSVNNNSRCGSGTLSLTLSNISSGINYRWYDALIGGSLVGSGSSFTTPSLSSSRQYYVSASNINNCKSPRILVNAIIDQIPNVTLTNTSNIEFCSGESRTLVATSTSSNITFKWYRNSIEVVGETGNQLVARTAGDYTVKTISLSGSCESPISTSITVTIRPLPSVTLTAQNTTICAGASTRIIAQGAITYRWIGTNLNRTTGDTVVATPASSTSYSVIGTNQYGCSDTTSINITVIPNFSINILTNTDSLCSGQSTAISFVSTAPSASLRWTSVASAGITGNTTTGNGGTIADLLINSLSTSGTVTYTLYATLSGCEAPTRQIVVKVNPSPNLVVSGQRDYCQSGTTAINMSSTTSGTRFSWQVITATNATGSQNGSGNSISDLLVNTSSTLPATVTYRITANANGCPSPSQDVTITIYPRPVFTVTNNTVCSGNVSASTINSSIPDPSIRYQWQVLDSGSIRGARSGIGNTINNLLINPSSSNPDTVTYQVNITSDNCTVSPLIVNVIVIPTPKVRAQNQTICSEELTNIALSSTAGIGTFSWSVTNSSATVTGASSGNGSSISQRLFNSSSTTSGTVTYAIRTLVNGCQGVDTSITVTVRPLPLVTLSTRRLDFCDAGRILVDIQSSIPSSTIQWQVIPQGPVIGYRNGSGNQINQLVQNTSRTQIAYLKYNINATINGCIGHSDTVTIQVNPKPQANFDIISDSVYCTNNPVMFINTTLPISGTTLNYHWDFGNGLTSIDSNGTTTFSTSGRYIIKLKTTSIEGCSDSIVKKIKVVELPVANFTLGRAPNACTPVFITFNNLSTFSNLDVEPTWNWDFGNGQSSTLRFPSSITYLGSPRRDTSYFVRLTITTRCGQTVKMDTVTVSPKPTANFLVESDTVCARLAARIANTTIGQANYNKWNWGDGSPEEIYSDQRSLIHRFIYFGNSDTTYQIKLFTSNPCGSDSIVKNVVVRSNNVYALFNSDQSIGCTPLTVNFRSNQTGANSTIWDFDNGIRRIGGTSQTYTFNNSSNVIDTLKVMLVASSGGCSRDTFSQNIIVYPKPQVSFSTTKRNFCFGDSVRVFNSSLTSNLTYHWDFGDGDTSNLRNPSGHIYSRPGRYLITLQGYSSNFYNCSNIDTHTVIIDTNRIVKADFTIDTSKGCQPLTVTFTKQTISAINWRWDFGDGNSLYNINPAVYTYSSSGTYIPKLKVYGACNSDSIVGRLIQVFPAPNITFSVSALNLCLGDTLFLSNTSGIDISFTWNFGDNTSSTFRSPLFHVFRDTGFYNIVLTGRALTAPYCIGSRTVRVHIVPKPIASFNVVGTVPVIICQNNTVFFNNTSSLASRYFWDFGISGATSLDVNPFFKYPTSGVFRVKLIAYSQYGCSDTSVQFINIYPNPVPNFALSSYSGCSPLPITISNLTVYPNAIQGTFNWDFGNGNTYNGYYAIPSQVYVNNSTSIKTYKIKLTCTTSFGCSDTFSTQVVVYPKPIIDFLVVKDTLLQDNALFQFINNTTPNSPWSYKWVWGDGSDTSVSNSNPIFHRYDTTGNIKVKLLVITANGCLDSIVRTITILPVKPKPSFVLIGADTLKGCRPFTIQVRNTSRYSKEYKWDFGGGIVFNNANPPPITYYNAGTYTIKLTAKNAIGIDSFIQNNVVFVDELPVASFTNSPKLVVLPNQLTYFQNLSTGASRYLWLFGDSTTSNEFEPSHLYTDTGKFTVTLIAYTTNGCIDTIVIDESVIARNDGRIQVPNAFTPSSSFGLNDVFLPVMDGAIEFKMLVFDRWGEIIFESNNSTIGWDGKHRGQICTPDLYPYKIEALFSNGDKKTIIGKVYLIR